MFPSVDLWNDSTTAQKYANKVGKLKLTVCECLATHTKFELWITYSQFKLCLNNKMYFTFNNNTLHGPFQLVTIMRHKINTEDINKNYVQIQESGIYINIKSSFLNIFKFEPCCI